MRLPVRLTRRRAMSVCRMLRGWEYGGHCRQRAHSGRGAAVHRGRCAGRGMAGDDGGSAETTSSASGVAWLYTQRSAPRPHLVVHAHRRSYPVFTPFIPRGWIPIPYSLTSGPDTVDSSPRSRLGRLRDLPPDRRAKRGCKRGRRLVSRHNRRSSIVVEYERMPIK